ncbi:hypothetical protein SAMN05444920_12662 [Nonomuraea solani]|uniref:Histidine kinase/HSP90-like ATPase domain-containing protein n=1 Tax=Nonomuraea solani TaxID=1144553 RepID=A0A1H6F0D5_9ACTN|nr:ATP-binding protein [Nonomuraea solani]SEH02404.1 hypothetical protein SAMN05444920_12662 [Nonomuraea solani]
MDRTQHISDEQSRLLGLRTYRQPLGEEFPDLAPGLVMSTFCSRPVWRGMAWRQAFPGRADQSAPARRMVGRLLADTGRRQDAEWVTAELVANALCHSRSGQEQGFFVMEVLRGAEVARIVVYDLGGGSVPDFSRTPGSVPGLAEHGRGLAGVAELAVRVGVAGDAVIGHAVWAELALTGGTAGALGKAEEACLVSVGEVIDSTALAVESGRGELEPVAAGLGEREMMRADLCVDPALMGHEEGAGQVPGSLPGVVTMPVGRPGSGRQEEAGGRGTFASLAGGVFRQEEDRVSAFGQEPWARQALAGLRRDWPDWAFLVVRSRWRAMRGPHVVIDAAGPEELRQALPPISGKSVLAGSAIFVLDERGAAGSGSLVSPLLGLRVAEPDEGRVRPGTSPLPASVAGVGVGGLCGGGGSGVGLSGTLTVGLPPLGVVAAERSGTGTWAVAAADGARVGWWPWGRRRDRSRLETRVGAGGRRAGRDRFSAGGAGPRHRRVRSEPAAAVAAAVAA